MRFQIKQNYGGDCGAYIYFDSDTENLDELKQLAINEMKEDWSRTNEQLYSFSSPRKAKPTIKVCQYLYGKKVKDGIRFKTRWR